RVTVVDCKARSAADFARVAGDVLTEVRTTLETLASFGMFAPQAAAGIAARVAVLREDDAHQALQDAAVIFEGVPEVVDLKREVLARVSSLAGAAPIIASTTSTILVDD